VIHAGDVLWFSADASMAPDPALPIQEAWLHQLLESDNEASQVLAETIFDWKSAGTRVDQPIQRRIAGRSWWVLFRELSSDAGPEYLGLWVPATDLAARLQTPDTWETYVLVGGLAVAILALISLAFEYRRRLRTMAADRGHCRDSADELRLLIARGESDRLEFKSTMRWNLKANKPGKEIELAWLKTVVAFLNTDGGTILLGVGDDGQILGVEPDGFKNDDKFLLHFNNLINRHVGVEFARCLRFDLRSIGDKTIFVLDCYSADDPAFLKRDDDDTFYVRIGPASRKLSLRKTLEYLEQL